MQKSVTLVTVSFGRLPFNNRATVELVLAMAFKKSRRQYSGDHPTGTSENVRAQPEKTENEFSDLFLFHRRGNHTSDTNAPVPEKQSSLTG